MLAFLKVDGRNLGYSKQLHQYEVVDCVFRGFRAAEDYSAFKAFVFDFPSTADAAPRRVKEEGVSLGHVADHAGACVSHESAGTLTIELYFATVDHSDLAISGRRPVEDTSVAPTVVNGGASKSKLGPSLTTRAGQFTFRTNRDQCRVFDVMSCLIPSYFDTRRFPGWYFMGL